MASVGGKMVSYELERMWKEAFVIIVSNTFMDELRKTTKLTIISVR
jgi:hypothetical protein